MERRHWLIKLRKIHQLTQEQVAARAFIERSYYAQLEYGTKNPSKEVAKKLGKVLGFHYSSFDLEGNPFSFALQHSPMVIAHCDLELRYTWIFNPHQDFEPTDVIGKTDQEINENEGTLALMELKRNVIEKQIPIRRKITFPLSEGKITYDVFGHPLYDDESELIGVATASTEWSKKD
ncbi:hypothetical protein GCM10007216_32090 [Thalassobacillus devorans]|uniref:HTH cro/C1-type domain-containing protein n=1 Tax=Thalassobacillus devorans TaxID=279813 RepID=A0ABQ1PL26_9BACI|nr:helix-turn-helix domain-containing protein [Thalassobacillus devorans]NIK30170.1 transcriptional regulator with XRE-family HTH domain [Thalassobacillus devorans]GGC98878.1 hypothetical protein GCM10007216_32090 [Thalassobacillus devorans]